MTDTNNMTEISMANSKYKILYPTEQIGGVRVLRVSTNEDITEQVMNNPFFDLLLEYIDTKAELDRYKEIINSSINNPPFMKTVLGELPVSSDSMRKLNDELDKIYYKYYAKITI